MRRITPRTYDSLLRFVETRGKLVTVGEKSTKEILNLNLLLSNPLDRLVVSDSRKMNFPFGIAEWVGLLTGESAVAFFQRYVSTYANYSTGGVVVDGAYGDRLNADARDQVSEVIKTLKEDPFSRRAVISIYHAPIDLNLPSKNTPCTLTMQFLVRDEKLHAIVNMRSNDAVWGLTYDMFMFTMLQEYVARKLGREPGNYYHNAGSFHIYEQHFGLYQAMAKETRWPRTMRPMPDLSHKDIEALRLIYWDPASDGMFSRLISSMDPYAQNLAFAARAFDLRKDPDPKVQKMARTAYLSIDDLTIKRVLRPWMVVKKVAVQS